MTYPDQDVATGKAEAAAPTELTASQRSVVDARLAAVSALYGDRWDDEQRAHVRRDIERQVVLASHLRRTQLDNDDEPEIVFVPFRASPDAWPDGRR